MTGAYVYTPGIWPSLAAAIILTVLGLYSWRRRSVPGALPLVAGSLFGALVLLGIALETADLVHLPLLIPLDLAAAAVLPAWITYAIALFGFRIFDPLAAARRTVIEQMDAGLVVFDAAWCLVSLNPAAERILGVRAAQARGKTWQLLRSSIGPLPTLPGPTPASAGASTEVPEMMFGSGLRAQYYAPTLSSLTDYRGLIVGHLLLLRDVTGQRQAETRILEQQRVLATLRERERLGRELHDGAGQVLAYFSMQAQAIAKRLQEGDLATAEAQLRRLAEAAQEAHADIRESILSLKTVPAGEWSFLAILKQYLARYGDQCGIAAELRIEPGLAEEAFSPECGVQLLRVIQEALANARKHSGARSVRVTLARQDREAVIVVEDDGVGFDPGKRAPSDVCGHYGLDFMAERMAEIGGRLNIQSVPGAGSRVLLHAPVRGDCEEAP